MRKAGVFNSETIVNPKSYLLRVLFAIVLSGIAGDIVSQGHNFNVSLLSVLNPFTGTVGIGSDGRKYSGCWGYTHPQTNEEFAILGSCIGTHFINITNPGTPTVSAFVPGRPSSSWREIKTYQNYCYVISDDPSPNRFQIIDISSLPNSVSLVYDGTDLFERAHTLFVEGDKLYVASITSTAGASYSSMNVYSLQNPLQPVLLRKLNQDYPFIPGVHDMFVVNDTVYASCGPLGLYIFKYDEQQNKFSQLGSFTAYENPTANHSSWISKDKKHLVFCDEIYASPAKLINIENLSNISLAATFIPGAGALPHNPYVVDDLAVIASYQDGINIYNISDPTFVFHAGAYDTYPAGGLNTGNYGTDDLKGCWGAYPFFPSGKVIASDITNGLFVFDITEAKNATGLKSQNIAASLNIFPNPASKELTISCTEKTNVFVEIAHVTGKTLYSDSFFATQPVKISLDDIENGTYIVTVKTASRVFIKKLVVCK